MRNHDESPGLISALGPPAVVLVSAYLVHLLPVDVQIALTAWTLLSFPIGVLFGHCVLSEE
jgi:hypothetical protein